MWTVVGGCRDKNGLWGSYVRRSMGWVGPCAQTHTQRTTDARKGTTWKLTWETMKWETWKSVEMLFVLWCMYEGARIRGSEASSSAHRPRAIVG